MSRSGRFDRVSGRKMRNAVNGAGQNDEGTGCVTTSGEEAAGGCGHSFVVKDCALTTIGLGVRAQNLKEFREALVSVPSQSLYHHFWERLLRPHFSEPEYNNDFGSWVYHALHDKALAERLAIIDPSEFHDLEALRNELIEVVDQRLDETETVLWARQDQQFHFLKSSMVIFDTCIRLADPFELVPLVPRLSTGSVFYHFIDARRRTDEGIDDFSAWLRGCGPEYEPLVRTIAGFDPYFSSLERIRDQLSDICTRYLGGGRPGASGNGARRRRAAAQPAGRQTRSP